MSRTRRAVIGVWIGSLVFKAAPRLLGVAGLVDGMEKLHFVGYVTILPSIVFMLIPLAILMYFNYHLIDRMHQDVEDS